MDFIAARNSNRHGGALASGARAEKEWLFQEGFPLDMHLRSRIKQLQCRGGCENLICLFSTNAAKFAFRN
jgi:hypothetical protein